VRCDGCGIPGGPAGEPTLLEWSNRMGHYSEYFIFPPILIAVGSAWG
jgi:hypothetical protein